MRHIFVGGKNKRGAKAQAARIAELEAEVADLKAQIDQHAKPKKTPAKGQKKPDQAE